ncbi:hypothetical protein C0J52_25938, partial [Blattella germanica]
AFTTILFLFTGLVSSRHGTRRLQECYPFCRLLWLVKIGYIVIDLQACKRPPKILIYDMENYTYPGSNSRITILPLSAIPRTSIYEAHVSTTMADNKLRFYRSLLKCTVFLGQSKEYESMSHSARICTLSIVKWDDFDQVFKHRQQERYQQAPYLKHRRSEAMVLVVNELSKRKNSSKMKQCVNMKSMSKFCGLYKPFENKQKRGLFQWDWQDRIREPNKVSPHNSKKNQSLNIAFGSCELCTS